MIIKPLHNCLFCHQQLIPFTEGSPHYRCPNNYQHQLVGDNWFYKNNRNEIVSLHFCIGKYQLGLDMESFFKTCVYFIKPYQCRMTLVKLEELIEIEYNLGVIERKMQTLINLQ